MTTLNSVWTRLRARFGTRRVRDAEQLAEFLSRHSWFIAQKCADDYCRNKVGMAHFALEGEQAYRDALDVCRWEGYAAVLAALTVVVQRALLETGLETGRLEAALVGLYKRILNQQPAPVHRPQGWDDLVAELPARLRAARADPAPSLMEIAAAAGRRLFAVLPIHASYRELDEPVVVGAVQFNFVSFSDRLRREVDAVAVARDLTEMG